MGRPVLATENLRKCFGSLIASDDVSITLNAGEIHAIIGPNGAGKSTLIAQICGTLAADSGGVRFYGQDITALSARMRAKIGLARTFQISALAMEDTVLENVLLGVLGATASPWHFFKPVMKNSVFCAKAENALKRVGLDSMMHERTATLSHGQRRLLEVAIALTLAPRAFIMDEPMAGLGAEGTQNLTVFLDQLRHEAPILLVEHDMDVVFALADRITVLNYGKVIATGTVEAVRTNSLVKAAYLGAGA